jgi:glycosyltransferase involved in cell wall biosynthesis
MRVRQAFNVADSDILVLCCGAIRPYKNFESVIQALADSRCGRVVVLVAGTESHYSNSSSTDPLAQTRQLVAQFGIADRVRLVPHSLSMEEMSDFFEAADAIALPYLQSYGSGMLMLGMTFEKHILATPVGGAEEYLQGYQNCTLLKGTEPRHVADALADATQALDSQHPQTRLCRPDLAWPAIAGGCIDIMNARFNGARQQRDPALELPVEKSEFSQHPM